MRRLLALALAFGWALAGAPSVLAGTAAVSRIVDDDGKASPPSNCNSNAPASSSIEATVNISGPGDIVNVCPGTYVELVSVEPGKNGLTIRSLQPLAAVIKADATIPINNARSIVRITSSLNVNLLGFTVTGPGPGPCGTIGYGVRVDGGGSANIVGNRIVDIRDEPLSGCQNGVAILVGRNFEGQTGSARIVGNLIERYQKNGPTVDNAGSSALIQSNRILGIGPTLIIAQNGIQISRGAVATVRSNQVRDHAYMIPVGQQAFTATGILLFATGSGTVVDRNDLLRNQDGVGIYTTSSNLISKNSIIGRIPGFGEGNPCCSLGDGIYAFSDTSSNRIERNFLRDNVEHDCHDDSLGAGTAGTANFWIKNDGQTDTPDGICQDEADDDDEDDDDDDDDDIRGSPLG